MAEETKQSPEELRTISKGLIDLQLQLEPVRDKALDQKSFYTGYAACAENFIKVIVSRANAFSAQADEIENPTPEETSTEDLIAEKFKNVENPGDLTDESISPE